MQRVATEQDFDVLVQALLAMARQVHARGEDAPPVLAMLLREPSELGMPVILAAPVGMLQHETLGDSGKDFIGHLLRTSAERPDVLVAAHLSEAWQSIPRDGVVLTPEFRPSEDPNRVEGLVISLLSAECQAMLFCEIERTADGRVIKEGTLQFETAATPLQGRLFRQTRPEQYN